MGAQSVRSRIPAAGRDLYGRPVKSPWKQLQQIDAHREYVALASLIPPKSRGSTLRLFKGSRAVAKQMASTPGVVGFSMLARPVRKEYATLSLWVDDAALDAFARAMPHARLRDALAREMGETTFVRWTVKGSDGVPSWRDAFARLASSTASDERHQLH